MMNKKKSKGQMSLEYVVKITIVVVVLAVVIGMIQKFRNDAVDDWNNINPDEPEEIKSQVVTKNFDATDMAHFIEACWAETRGAEDDFVCFVINGVYQGGADSAENDIRSEVESSLIRDHLEIEGDFSKDLFSVSFELVGNMIVVK